jgi:hypothetical protein
MVGCKLQACRRNLHCDRSPEATGPEPAIFWDLIGREGCNTFCGFQVVHVVGPFLRGTMESR